MGISKFKPILDYRPLIAGTLLGPIPLSRQIKTIKKAKIDLIELRLDTFASVLGPAHEALSFSKALIHVLKKQTGKPILLTLRSYKECGQTLPKSKRINDTRRGILLEALLPKVDLIDIEIRHRVLAQRLTRIAHKKKVGVIHSYHDFGGPGNWSSIRQWSEVSRKLKGDIFKVAVRADSEKDLKALFLKASELKNQKKILIGMGRAGLLSRLIGFTFGSILTYGHLGQKSVGGQLPAAELSKKIRLLYPR